MKILGVTIHKRVSLLNWQEQMLLLTPKQYELRTWHPLTEIPIKAEEGSLNWEEVTGQ